MQIALLIWTIISAVFLIVLILRKKYVSPLDEYMPDASGQIKISADEYDSYVYWAMENRKAWIRRHRASKKKGNPKRNRNI